MDKKNTTTNIVTKITPNTKIDSELTQPDESVIETLEKLLKEARQGQFNALGFVVFRSFPIDQRWYKVGWSGVTDIFMAGCLADVLKELSLDMLMEFHMDESTDNKPPPPEAC